MKLKKVLLTCLLLFISITFFSMVSFSQTIDGQNTKMGIEFYDGDTSEDQTDDSSFPNTSSLKPKGGNKLSSMLPSTGEEAVKYLVILGSILLIFSGMYFIKKWYQAFKA